MVVVVVVVTTSRSPRELFSENRVATLYPAVVVVSLPIRTISIYVRAAIARFFFRSPVCAPGDGVSDTIYAHMLKIKKSNFSARRRHDVPSPGDLKVARTHPSRVHRLLCTQHTYCIHLYFIRVCV